MWPLHSRARKRNFRTQHQRNANVRIVSEQCHMATGFCDGYIRYSFFVFSKKRFQRHTNARVTGILNISHFFLEGNQINEQCKKNCMVIFFPEFFPVKKWVPLFFWLVKMMIISMAFSLAGILHGHGQRGRRGAKVGQGGQEWPGRK